MLLFAAICGLGVYRLTGSVMTAFLLTAVTVPAAHFRLDAAPEMLFGISGYAAFLSAIVIVCALLRIARIEIPMGLVLAVVGLLSAVYFILRNQFMLLRLVNRRSNTDAEIPQEIRRGNLMLVGGVIVLLALLFVFRAPLMQLLYWMQDAARRFAGMLLEWIARLVAWLGGNAPEPEPDEIADLVPEMPKTLGKPSPFWLLLWIPELAATLYIVHYFLEDWIYSIRTVIARIIRKLRGMPEEKTLNRAAENAEYADIETTLRPQESRRKRLKNWKRALKSWQRMPDNDEKFYAGYRLLLTAPCWAAGEIRAADTVRSIEEKWMRGHTPPEMLQAVTADFQTDRYAERGLPPEALGDIAAALNGIAKT